eukprot:TRINITY_DN9444_c0_g4_i1.p1 TRINITY_DN9444_c0_g4~~TRINITY_DN9444_c0_g4_i1.p1  ORF type:complete len:494 (-),score=86.58 TRINITY_DN9444_c0_g4_i1:586-2067(-)
MATSRNLLITAIESFPLRSYSKKSPHNKYESHRIPSHEPPCMSLKKSSSTLNSQPPKGQFLSVSKYNSSYANTARVESILWNNASLTKEIADENVRIKRKIKEYENFRKTRNELNQFKTAQGVSYKELNERFNSISFRIRLLLSAETPIEEVIPGRKTTIELSADSARHYKVSLENQLPPLKLRLSTQKGIGAVSLFISQTYKHPNRNHHEFSYLIGKKDFYVFLKGDKPKTFKGDWMYLGFECYRDFSSCLAIGFARKRLVLTEKEVRPLTTMTKRTAETAESPESVKRGGNRMRLKALLLKKETLVNKALEERRAKTEEEKLRIRAHRRGVLELRERYEAADVGRKLLFIHRDKVNALHDRIIQHKLQQIYQLKESAMTWIQLSKLTKIARRLYCNCLIKKKQIAQNERTYFAVIRIMIWMKGKLRKFDDSCDKRTRNGVARYFVRCEVVGLCRFMGKREDYSIPLCLKLLPYSCRNFIAQRSCCINFLTM